MKFIGKIYSRIILAKPFEPIRPIIFRSSLYHLKGKIQTSNSDFTTSILGEELSTRYFSKLVYSGKSKTQFLGKRSYQHFVSSIEKPAEDLKIIQTNWQFSNFLRKNGYLILPRANFVADLDDSLENITRRISLNKRKHVKKLLKTGWRFELTKDPIKTKSFYNNMYLPHTLGRHGELAAPISLDLYEKMLTKGYLMMVRKDNEYVSGQLVIPQRPELKLPILGVANNKTIYDTCLALYYFGLIHGIQEGYARVDFGETVPFMQDGVFQYKRQFGLRIRPPLEPSTQIFGVKFSETSEPIKNFVSSNPFIFMNEGNLSGLINIESEEDILKPFLVPGLSSLYIVSSNISTPNQKPLKLQKFSGKDSPNQNNSALKLFAAACKAEGYSMYYLPLKN